MEWPFSKKTSVKHVVFIMCLGSLFQNNIKQNLKNKHNLEYGFQKKKQKKNALVLFRYIGFLLSLSYVKKDNLEYGFQRKRHTRKCTSFVQKDRVLLSLFYVFFFLLTIQSCLKTLTFGFFVSCESCFEDTAFVFF